MSNGLHLLLAGLLSRCYSLHVPGLSNPADIPSRVPFIAVGGNRVLDPVKVRARKTGAADEVTEIDLATRKDTFPGSRRLASLRLFTSASSDLRPGVAALAAEVDSSPLGRFAL